MNDIVVEKCVDISLVDWRLVSAKVKPLKGPRTTGFDSDTRNIGDWTK